MDLLKLHVQGAYKSYHFAALRLRWNDLFFSLQRHFLRTHNKEDKDLLESIN
jgi:hypothetical protein